MSITLCSSAELHHLQEKSRINLLYVQHIQLAMYLAICIESYDCRLYCANPVLRLLAASYSFLQVLVKLKVKYFKSVQHVQQLALSLS